MSNSESNMEAAVRVSRQREEALKEERKQKQDAGYEEKKKQDKAEFDAVVARSARQKEEAKTVNVQTGVKCHYCDSNSASTYKISRADIKEYSTDICDECFSMGVYTDEFKYWLSESIDKLQAAGFTTRY